MSATRAAVAPGTTWTLTNHYITREDHPCYGTRTVVVSRVTSTRFYYDSDRQHINWPRVAQIRATTDGVIRLYGGGVSQAPTDLFVTLRPVSA